MIDREEDIILILKVMNVYALDRHAIENIFQIQKSADNTFMRQVSGKIGRETAKSTIVKR